MLRFDHAVIVVPSLARAVRDFESQGFRVVLGGSTGPVHNALVVFADGTYLELTTTRPAATRPLYRALHRLGITGRVARARNDMLGRFLPWLGAPAGPIDWCIRVDDLASTVRRLRDCGVDMVDAEPFERTRPDGQVARWLLGGPRDPRLPFFIEDETPVEIRVPKVDEASHPNGAEGVRALSLTRAVAAEVEAMANALAHEKADGRSPGPLDNVALLPAASAEPFALQLFGSGAPGELDSDKTFGTRIHLVR